MQQPLTSISSPGFAAPLDTASLDAALDAILAADPPPHIVAAAETGLCLPMPPEIPCLPSQHISGVSTFLELVVAADMGRLVEAWERARRSRFAQVSIHLRRDPGRSVTVYFVDARHRYAVYLGIIAGAHGTMRANHESPALFRPRLWTVDRNETGCALSVDPAVEQVLGWKPDELVGRRLTDLIHPDDQPLGFASWVAMLGRPGCDQRLLVRYRNRDGQHIWFEVTHRNLLMDPANPRVFSQFFDVSERVEAVEQLRASEEILRRLTETLPQGVAHIAADRSVVYLNERLLTILGIVRASRLDDLIAPVAAAERVILDSAVLGVLTDGQPLDLEVSFDRAGDLCRCNIAMRALMTGQGGVSGAILSVTDVTERERLRAEVQRQARFDFLTGLLNRGAILETLELALSRLKPGVGIAVLFIDLDGFKQINDELGHAAGDALLRCVGARLDEAMRVEDTAGRLGGDEFVVVCEGVDTSADALAIARRIHATLAAPTIIGTRHVVPGSSIGVAWTDVAVDQEMLVARADGAMYQAKRNKTGPMLCTVQPGTCSRSANGQFEATF